MGRQKGINMHIDLPIQIDKYFTSELTDDTEILSEIFAKNAVVGDESAKHRGIEAIKAWKKAGKLATGYMTEPKAVHHHENQTIVTAEVSGRFPGSPATLTYAFTLQDDRISELEIH